MHLLEELSKMRGSQCEDRGAKPFSPFSHPSDMPAGPTGESVFSTKPPLNFWEIIYAVIMIAHTFLQQSQREPTSVLPTWVTRTTFKSAQNRCWNSAVVSRLASEPILES